MASKTELLIFGSLKKLSADIPESKLIFLQENRGQQRLLWNSISVIKIPINLYTLNNNFVVLFLRILLIKLNDLISPIIYIRLKLKQNQLQPLLNGVLKLFIGVLKQHKIAKYFSKDFLVEFEPEKEEVVLVEFDQICKGKPRPKKVNRIGLDLLAGSELVFLLSLAVIMDQLNNQLFSLGLNFHPNKIEALREFLEILSQTRVDFLFGKVSVF